eukprot:UN25991
MYVYPEVSINILQKYKFKTKTIFSQKIQTSDKLLTPLLTESYTFQRSTKMIIIRVASKSFIFGILLSLTYTFGVSKLNTFGDFSPSGIF